MTKQMLVTNTGPLIALTRIGCLFPASEIFDIFVPAIVAEEWRSAPEIWPDFLKVLPKTIPDPLLRFQLDRGEASVIESALQYQYLTLLIDERKARKVARNIYGLTVVGTARILVQLRKAGLIGELAPLFADLRASSYWMDTSIVNWALKAAGEA
jgi:predicted nucleic acid-binding protein